MIEIRYANHTDRDALVRLAQRDSTDVPSGPLLVAEEDGVIRAALLLSSGETIADPFVPTERLLATLTAYATLTGVDSRRRHSPLMQPLRAGAGFAS